MGHRLSNVRKIFYVIYQVTFRMNLYSNLDELQSNLGEWLEYYINEKTHQGNM